MKNSVIRTALITAVMVAVIMKILPASANDWVQFQKDNMHTGWTTDGSLIWEWTSSNGRVFASPALSVVDGRKFIYFTTNVDDGSAYCLEDMGDTYEVRWIWDPPYPDEQWILHGIAVADGVIYFGTDFGELYALAGICGDVDCSGGVTTADLYPLFMDAVYGDLLNFCIES